MNLLSNQHAQVSHRMAPTPVVPASPSILIVDDEQGIRDICRRALQRAGYQVDVAENGLVALQKCRQTPFDLVLTDLQMPEMTGITMLQHLRTVAPDIDVIVFTAYGTFETAREALRLGASDYLTKPVSLDDLQHTVNRVLEWRRVRLEKQRLSEIISLYELGQTFTRTLDVTTALHEITRLLFRRFSAHSLSLSIFHPDDEMLELLIDVHSDSNGRASEQVPMRQMSEECLIHAHEQLIQRQVYQELGTSAAILLRTGERPIGLLYIERTANQPSFGSDDRLMLNVCASQIGTSLENARLYQQLKQQNLQTVSALVAAIEKRDPYTSGHSHQVMIYAVRTAQQISLPPQRIEHIRYGALLHDIGKIGIRDYILLKPGPLTDEERKVMEEHPTIGAEIVREIKALRDVIPIIECHHERLDGRGYPHGRTRIDLSEEARILAICDAYDAMTTDRAYRKAMTRERAFTILHEGRNQHWDGALLDVFFDIIDREGDALLSPNARPEQLAVNGLLSRPTSVKF